MGIEDRGWRKLEGLARTLSSRAPREVVRELRTDLSERARRAGVRALDRLVSKIAGQQIHTDPKRLPAPQAHRPVPIDAPELKSTPVPRSEPVASAEPVAPREPVRQTPAPEPPESFGVERSAPPAPVVSAPPPPVVSAPPPPVVSAPPPPVASEPPPPATEEAIADLRPRDTSSPLPELPERFGIDRVVLLAGHSEWVFAYWEIDPERLSKLTASAEPRAELRLVDEAGAIVSRTIVDPRQGRQHLRIPELGKRYRAELVTVDPSNDGAMISRSRAVVSSRAGEHVETRNSDTMPPRPAE